MRRPFQFPAWGDAAALPGRGVASTPSAAVTRLAWGNREMARLPTWMTAIGRDGRVWWAPLVETVAYAAGISLALASQYLIQPFIWRNYGVVEILQGWGRIALQNAVVAFPIGTTLAVVGRFPYRRQSHEAAAMVTAMFVSAFLASWVAERLFDAPHRSLPGLLGEALRWTVVVGGLTLIYYIRLRSMTATAEANAADQKRAQLERLARQTELDVLQRQIEPHFLFNTLATARGLYRKAPERGAALLANLAAYMRASQGGGGEAANLGRELDLVNAYLGVCAARMGDRLKVAIDVDPALRSCEFPPLALGTLVENAIIHGLEPHPPGGTLRISAAVEDDRLEVAVEDNGRGFTDKAGGSGIGLSNTRARLSAMYGSAAGLRLAGGEAGGVRASIWLPNLVSP